MSRTNIIRYKQKINKFITLITAMLTSIVLSTSMLTPMIARASSGAVSSTQFQDPNPQPGDDFGASVSVSADGSTAVVGAQTYSNGSNALSGAAYVFINNGSGWSLATTLVPSDQGLYDRLGITTSINPNGNQIVVGADYIPYANVTPTKQGKAYVFSMPAGGWASNTITSESAELQGSDILPGDTFGWSVSQSSNGSEVLVTAEYKNVNGVGYAGEAYIFSEPAGGWNSVSSPITESQILLPSAVIANAFFGWAATISQDGTKAYISALNQGEVFEYIQPTNGWGSTGQLLNENSIIQSPTSIPGTPDSGFGFSLALSADASELIVGSPSETMQGSTATSSGTVFVFKNTPTGWANSAAFSASDAMYGGSFGYSLSLSQDGQSALVGAPQQTVTGLLDAGAAYLFVANPDGTWSQQTEIFEPTPVQNDDFGWSVSMLDSSNIFVGAPALTSAGVASNVVVNAAQRLSSHLSLSANTSKAAHGSAYFIKKNSSTPPPVLSPTISNFTASAGVGGQVTINGTNLSNALSVSFNGHSTSTFVQTSATKIIVTVPSSAQTGPITVTTASGSVTSTTNFTLNPVPAPSITSLTVPNPVLTQNVTIKGTNLLNTSSVTLNGLLLTIVSKKATAVVVTIPATAVTGHLVVTTPSGAATSSAVVSVPAPAISSLSVAKQHVGKNVTIHGTTFIGVNKVTLNGVNIASFTKTATAITFTVPAGSTTGYIVVTSPSGSATSSSKLTIY